jgi:hypothetical protein
MLPLLLSAQNLAVFATYWAKSLRLGVVRAPSVS